MLDKFVTRLHEINENPKTRLALDLLFVFILALSLIFCMLGFQGCFETRTVYAAEEDTVDAIFDESLPACTISSSFDLIYGSYNSYPNKVIYTVVDFVDDVKFDLLLDSSNKINLVFSDSSTNKQGSYVSYFWTGSEWGIYNSGTASINFSCSVSDFRGSSVSVKNSDGSVYSDSTIKIPLPPFSITTLGDYCLSISGGLFGVAKDAIDFIMEHPIALFGVVLFLFVSGSGIVKNLAKGV